MGKKRRMKANPAKYSKKYANHPIVRAWKELQADVSLAEEVIEEAAKPAEEEAAPAPAPVKKSAEAKAPAKKVVKKAAKSKAPSKSADKKKTKLAKKD